MDARLSPPRQELPREETSKTIVTLHTYSQETTEIAASKCDSLLALPLDNRRQIIASLPTIRPSIRHPYTSYAASMVELPIERIDYLFRSHYFQRAAEPLFSSNHVDSSFRMDAVFPGCLTAPAFINALLYSIVQTVNKGKASVEGLTMQGKALQTLNRSLTLPGNNLNYSDIGAIMVLQGVAYRWNDLKAYEAHTQGLIKLIHNCQSGSTCLTTLGKRAIFWQDLFAAILINSVRHDSHVSLSRVSWRHKTRPCVSSTLPVGFAKHRDILSSELLECFEDILELQATVVQMKKSTIDRLELSNMQASIESRLAFQKRACKNHVAECCRIAAFMCCFLSFTETWANALIPCRLSELLRKLLHDSIESDFWGQRRDLQTWLLLVGTSVTVGGDDHVDGLQQNWSLLLARFRLHCSQHFQGKSNKAQLDGALNDFVYCANWLEQRWEVQGWPEIEVMLNPE